ncbi:GNAT family N-acetyltransferase [Robertmurraya sp. DFI.2.37]|uniref:GNAT family N-acetyltransferase n=1 Tax=Robertmurraya sp. DFI.2.37 TaxID=3031819 RepID=UPI0012492A30|nr:GNAT family N-acetyltransferase [Robertmurraya sp. DFI.2.37]MDF1511349.1 GNAT family N-acetyltransferase [Robertmurraya sp. DFI.2.37]
MIIRQITPTDAESFVRLIHQIERESPFMLFEADERNAKPEDVRKRIDAIGITTNSTIFVAEVEQELVGYLMAVGGEPKRKKYCVYIVVGILAQHQGKGIGKRLFERLQQWAKEEKIRRLELTVITRNEPVVRLYKKMGFDIEGVKRDSLYVNGEFVDEYYMSMLL